MIAFNKTTAFYATRKVLFEPLVAILTHPILHFQIKNKPQSHSTVVQPAFDQTTSTPSVDRYSDEIPSSHPSIYECMY